MKNFIALFLVAALLSCSTKDSKDFVSIHGKIINPSKSTLTIQNKTQIKEIAVNENGEFSDTLSVTDGFYGFHMDKYQSVIYLKNGYNFELNFSTDDFPNSLKYNGDGAATNTYLLQKLELIRNENLQDYAAIFGMEKPDFDERMNDLEERLNLLLEATEGIEPEVITHETESNKQLIAFFSSNYEAEHPKFVTINKGETSPLFKFANTEGQEVSLEDFRGKYVFIDIWATWCAPCKYEFPYLKKLEEDYKDKNLVVVSLSVDNPEHKEKWLQMIKNENLQGIQLLSDNALHPEFFRAYNVNAIPRFILLDKEGKVLESNAPKPSNPKLHEILSSLNI